jgi:hypothetical protein
MTRSTSIGRAVFLAAVSLIASASLPRRAGGVVPHNLARSEVQALFIGNSFTYFNNMPRLLEAISETVDGPLFKTEMVAIGGARLEDLWKEGSALNAIHKKRWDYVVLNEQSALGGGIVNGEKRIGDPANFFKYAELFDAEIRQVGAKTVIMMTWKDKKDSERIQDKLDRAFVEFRDKMHGEPILAPVSNAWGLAKLTAPDIDLYFTDNHHPSKEGSYLIACTVYATITQRSPEGAVARIAGASVDDQTGLAQAGKLKTLVNLSHRVAYKLQWIASKSAIPPPQFAPPVLKNAPITRPALRQNKQPAHLN